MSVDRRRHGRQIRLVEVGEAGQARISAAVLGATTAGAARTVEVLYLEGVGARIAPAACEDRRRARRVEEALDALALESSAARDVAEGALAALVAIRDTLGID